MKKTIKFLFHVLATIIVAPFILISNIEGVLFPSEQVFVLFGSFLSLIPGRFGSYMRVAYYRYTTSIETWEFFVGFGSILTHRNIEIGQYSSIGMYCILGSVKIGDNVLLANRVSIPSGRHQHFDDIKKNISQKTSYNMIKVGNNCWIGESSVIMNNIGTSCIIGAGSVVVKPVESNTVAAGNPAKKLKTLEK
ncbi:MAG: acyltransferase [Pseudomonadota bacterium]